MSVKTGEVNVARQNREDLINTAASARGSGAGSECFSRFNGFKDGGQSVETLNRGCRHSAVFCRPESSRLTKPRDLSPDEFCVEPAISCIPPLWHAASNSLLCRAG